MLVKELNGIWKLRILGENVYGIPEEYIDAKVPGSVYGTLLEKGLMPDPYYRDNELDGLTGLTRWRIFTGTGNIWDMPAICTGPGSTNFRMWQRLGKTN